MRKQHQDRIKQDKRDINELASHIGKVQKLKMQHTQQKQQISNLKNTVSQLKSQNEQLKSRSLINQKSNGANTSQKMVKHNNRKQQHQVSVQIQTEDLQNNQDHNNQSQQQDEQAVVQINRMDLQRQKNNKQQIKKQSKIDSNNNIKPKIQHYPSKLQQGLNKSNKFLNDMSEPYQQTIMRNNSGYISTMAGRKLLSPQARTHAQTETWRLKFSNPAQFSDDNYQQLQTNEYEQQAQEYLHQKHQKTKKKLLNNLIEDLQTQISQNQQILSSEKISHKQTKHMLKTTIQQNAGLSQHNNSLINNNEVLARENSYLKMEVMNLTAQKNNLQTEFINMCDSRDQFRKRIHDEYQIEFMSMDAIYCQFETICAGTRYNSTLNWTK